MLQRPVFTAVRLALLGFFALVGLRGPGIAADPLDFWTRRYSGATNSSPNYGVFQEGKFVLGGNQIIVSEDGKNWRVALNDFGINGIVYGNGVFLASGPSGKIHISEDGDTWITRRIPFGSQPGEIMFGLGRFFVRAFGDPNHSLISSTNGFDWDVSMTNAPGGPFVFCNGALLTMGYPPGALVIEPMKSIDGFSFETATNIPPFNNIVCKDSTYVLTDRDPNRVHTVSVSTNGNDWIRIEPLPNLALRIEGLTIAGDFFVLTIGREWFLISRDGIHWTDHQVAIGTQHQVQRLIYGAGTMLSVGRFETASKVGQGQSYANEIFQSRSLLPTVPVALSIGFVPALTLTDGFVGAPYLIQAAESLDGPWSPLARVVPGAFPFLFCDPELKTKRLYRAVSE